MGVVRKARAVVRTAAFLVSTVSAVMRVVVAARVAVVIRVVLVAGAVRHNLVDRSTAVTSRIDFTPPRYISCGHCAGRTPPQGSAPRDCLPFQS